MDFDDVSEWLEGHADEMVDLQRELTARPALGPENGGEGEWEKARFLEGYLKEHGLGQVEHYDCPDARVPEGTRPNMIASVPGRSEGPSAWVLSHMDVVPPGELLPDGTWKGWDADPYEVQRLGERGSEDDRIVGRGVSDNQQSIVSSTFAARALVECGIQPPRPVRLLFVSEEETGSEYGLRAVLDKHEEMFTREDVIIVPDAGRDDGSMIEIAEKSVLWLEFHVKGKQTHASRPDKGINAFRAASWLVLTLDEGLRKRHDEVDSLYDLPRSTFEPTLHAANVPNVNTVPGEDIFCFDCRVLPNYDLDKVIAYVETQCKRADGAFRTRTEVSVRTRQDAPPTTPADSTVVRLLKPAIEQVYGVQPVTVGIGGGTVAAPFRARGFPAAVWMCTTDTAHQVNETCYVRHMVGDARVFAHVFLSKG